METIEREEIYRIAREILKQELETLLPISRELNDLKIVVKELAQVQVKSEERLAGLEKAMQELAQAQARTEARLEGVSSSSS